MAVRITKSVITTCRNAMVTAIPTVSEVKLVNEETKVVRVPGMIVENDKDAVADSKLEKGKFFEDFYKTFEDYRFGKITQ